MKKPTVRLFLGILIFILLAIGIVIYVYYFHGKTVESKEQATQIAKEYVYDKYKNSFDNYEISVELNDDIWIVSYGISAIYNEYGEISGATLGGGGPEVHIRKRNGRVLKCTLQK